MMITMPKSIHKKALSGKTILLQFISLMRFQNLEILLAAESWLIKRAAPKNYISLKKLYIDIEMTMLIYEDKFLFL